MGMPFYGESRRTLEKWRLAIPAKFQEGIGLSVFVAAAPKNRGLKILPGKFKPPKGKERMFHQVEVKRDDYSPRILIGEDIREQFHLSFKPDEEVLLVGCGDHLELYPAGSR